MTGHVGTAFEQKRVKPEFSRNSSSKFFSAELSPKCFHPQNLKIAYIYIANKSCQCKKLFKWRKNHPGVCQTSFGSVSDRFSIKWNGQGSFWRPLTQCFRPKMSKSPWIAWINAWREGKVAQNDQKNNPTTPKHQNNDNQPLSNERRQSGTVQEASDPVSENPRIWPF